MRRIAILTIFVLLCALRMLAAAEQPSGKAEQAPVNLQQAQAKLLAMEKSGVRNADLYNQLGISYYKQGNSGRAVLNFLRALRLNSNHRAARNNLDYAISQSMDREMYSPPSFLASTFQQVFNFFSLNALALLLLLMLILTVLCGHWLLHLPTGGDKAVPVMWLVIAGFVLILILTMTILKYNGYRSSNQAVILAAQTEGFSGPGQEFGKLFNLHAGLIVHITRVDRGWALLTLPNGGAGWVNAADVERVKPQP